MMVFFFKMIKSNCGLSYHFHPPQLSALISTRCITILFICTFENKFTNSDYAIAR